MGWMKWSAARRSGLCVRAEWDVCLEERKKKVPFLQLTESQTARHMAVLCGWAAMKTS
jgi:hypothetical protein